MSTPAVTAVNPAPCTTGNAPKSELNTIVKVFIYLALIVLVGSIIYWITGPSKSKPASIVTVSREGHATKTKPFRVQLDPLTDHIKATGPVKLVFVEDPTVIFFDIKVPDEEKLDKRIRWSKMMSGVYDVYSIEKDNIYFTAKK